MRSRYKIKVIIRIYDYEKKSIRVYETDFNSNHDNKYFFENMLGKLYNTEIKDSEDIISIDFVD